MFRKTFGVGLLALMVSCALVPGRSSAQTPLLSEVHTVAAASQATPIEHSFDISVPGTYKVTLVDQGASLNPTAPLTSVQLAITSGSTIVVGAQLKAAGSTTFSVTAAGTFLIHVIGTAGTVPGSGPIGITVTDAANNQIFATSDTVAIPSNVPVSLGLLDGTFTVPATGNYQVTLTDLQFPQALNALTLAIVVQGGALVTSLPGGPTTISLQSGVTYRIFAVGQLATGASAGLYGANVSPVGGGAPVYGKTVSVGAFTSLGSPVLTASSYTLNLSDLNFPAALSQVGAIVTLRGLPVAQLMAAGTKVFAGTADTYEVFGVGVPSSGTGSYSLSLTSSAGTALSIARAVSTAGGPTSAYSFNTTLTGGTYALDLADFQYPGAFSSLGAVAIQNGAVLGTPLTIGSSVTNSPATGTVSVTPTAGPVSLLVFAQPAAATVSTASAGLFGVDLTASGATGAAFETTQGVGQLFSSKTVGVATPGTYQATVSDVGFPAMFQTLSVIVTRGTSRIGSIFGGGTFPFPAVAGNYNVNFVAQPTSPAQAGTYSLSVTVAPTLVLKSSDSTIASGGTVTLTWTSQNTAACSASGGWSGSQILNGTATSQPITAQTTFTLTCTGTNGGSAAQSVTINVTAPPASKGGGGVVDPIALAILLGLGLAQARARSARARGRLLSFGRHA